MSYARLIYCQDDEGLTHVRWKDALELGGPGGPPKRITLCASILIPTRGHDVAAEFPTCLECIERMDALGWTI